MNTSVTLRTSVLMAVLACVNENFIKHHNQSNKRLLCANALPHMQATAALHWYSSQSHTDAHQPIEHVTRREGIAQRPRTPGRRTPT